MKSKRPFRLIIIFIIMGLGLATLFRWTPPRLLTARLPLLGQSDWGQGVEVAQTASVSPGRVTWLFFVNSKLGEGAAAQQAAVQQYLHYYSETAVAHANWEENRNGRFDHTFIPLTEQANLNQVLLCDEGNRPRISCEYRAQAGNWTIHADFTTRNEQILSLADMVELAQELGEKLARFVI